MDHKVIEPMQPLDYVEDRTGDVITLVVLIIDAVLLAVLELMFVTLVVGTTVLPVSAVVALVTNPWLVRAAGGVASGPRGAAGPLLAWALAMCVFGFTGPGGDVLLPLYLPLWQPSLLLWQQPNLSPLLLVLFGLLPATFVLGRVLRAARESAGESAGESPREPAGESPA